MNFYRGDFSEIAISLNSDEPLGVLDSAYLENESGVDGYVTLYHVASGQRLEVPMTAQPLETPLVSNDVFLGFHALSGMPNGAYQIRGRVRDLAGNYTILSQVNSPIGGERVINMTFTISAGFGLTNASDGFAVVGSFDVDRVRVGFKTQAVFIGAFIVPSVLEQPLPVGVYL